ncbi:MAG: hypothetical protein Cons2KO_10930 [Congregibacter sp.]
MKVIIVSILLALTTLRSAKSADLVIDREDYANRLHGFWLGSSIANWTGLPTENLRAEPPFFTDEDWQMPIGRDGQRVDFVLDDDPWKADDDTDIEYVYQRAMETAAAYKLTPQEIADAWLEHIGLPLLWVSNLAALGQMQNGALPPHTSLPENNPMWEMIDAQLTTEIFGALAPGRPDIALDIAHLPIHTTAHLHSAWAAEFYVIMHALVAVVDPGLTRGEQLVWLADKARKRLPEWSYLADMYDFVKADFAANPDKDDWERTRDKLYDRYQRQGAAGYRYQYPWDSGINFASSMVSLFYGQGDFKRTIQIGTLAGWDSDNPTATWGGLLGLLYGEDGLRDEFKGQDFSDAYLISRTRYNFPQEPDSFQAMARRGLPLIDRVVTRGMGGSIRDGNWIIPNPPSARTKAKADEHDAQEAARWVTIEDSDRRWEYQGFHTLKERWNASGATLTEGRANCAATIRFRGSAIRYFAHRSESAGSVRVSLNDETAVTIDLSSRDSAGDQTLGQYFVNVFERDALSDDEHRLHIRCDASARPKYIDMLSVLQ